MEKKTWSMNETQTNFVNVLKEMGAVTLLDIKLAGKGDFKTGSINVLVKKGIVTADEDREYAADVVYNGNVIGSIKKVYKVYKLVDRE